MMSVSEHNGQRYIRNLTDTGGNILKPISRIDKDRAFFTLQQGHADSHAVPDLENSREYFLSIESHFLSLRRMLSHKFDISRLNPFLYVQKTPSVRRVYVIRTYPL